VGVFTMPSLGADMESGRIVEWLVRPGDMVHRGDVVAVVDTTKAAIEVEVFEDGLVADLLVPAGTDVEVGTPLATITTEAGTPGMQRDSDVEVDSDVESQLAEDRPKTGANQTQQARPTEQAEPPDESKPADPFGRILPPEARSILLRATPPVRHLAHQLGIDLDSLAGSGPLGKITRKDVKSAFIGHQAESGGRRAKTKDRAPDPTPQHDPGPQVEPETLVDSATESQSRLRATPRARRLAAQRGIDLTSIAGTGTEGAITGPDVEKATVRPLPEDSDVSDVEEIAPKSGTHKATGGSEVAAGKIAAAGERKARRRSAIAALMARSAREIPHYYVSQTVDLSHSMDWLRSHNASLSVRDRVLPAALFLCATAQAAQEVGEVNGHWVKDKFVPADGVQLGVAVAMRDGGLLTPVIIDAHLLNLDEVMASLTDLVRRARSGRLRSREIEPGSITVSSLADGGPDALYGVIYPPQVALVGIGGVAERPWAVDGALAARPTVTLTIAADHRATDGRIGAKFLAALSRAITRPEEM
jgi:pyruvate dehydrogenase E2 component (dihydrolipoamide acetyltransferase)